ncbi:amino acid aminotransferase [Trinickia mobilis]|uniref:amino acid aminotransferase n=1 Tax=Trinickia mobilis TaxID=2816356 RepID=UPI001A8F3A5D|nr:amino acid aminotransferase [Trinickia mobilis]
MFSKIPLHHGDPITGLTERYIRDERPAKVNLGIGIYQDNEGKVPVLETVRAAASRVNAGDLPSPYPPVDGDATYRTETGRFLLGSAFETLRDSLAIVQTVGGSAALRVGAEFLKQFFPGNSVQVSDPTWHNHIGFFEGAGWEVNRYRYFNPRDRALDFEGMLEDLHSLKKNDIVLLHPCCHNPTGVDPNQEQWREILDVIQSRELIPFVDLAYPGFGDGLENDLFVVQDLARRGIDFVVSGTYSKVFSLYGERCGFLMIKCSGDEEAGNVLSQLKTIISRNYIWSPQYGSRLVSSVLSDAELRNQWIVEVDAMRSRLVDVRSSLHGALHGALPDQDFSHIVEQRGIFAYTGLTERHAEALERDFGVYIMTTGRICIASLNDRNLPYVADAFSQVIADVPL